MDDQRRIVYSVLDLSQHDEAKGEADAAYWSEDPLPLRFPTEVARVGYAVAGTVRMPVVKRGGRVEADAAERLEEQELDRFLSSTARLGAAAPFHAISDGTHLYVLRQSVRADHPDAVFRLADGTGSSGDPARTDYLARDGEARLAVVDATLLCDRFVLAGGELKPVLEVRYRHSRHKGRPDSAKDSLDAQDMEGRPFVEPTQELSFVRNPSGGRFTALLLAGPAPGHLRQPGPARHPAGRRAPAGEGHAAAGRGEQLRTRPPPRPLREGSRHRPARTVRSHPHDARPGTAGAAPARRRRDRFPRPVLRRGGLRGSPPVRRAARAGRRGGQEAVGDAQGVPHEAGDGFVRRGTGVDGAEDEGRGFLGKGFDVVGFLDDLEGVVAGGLGGDLGRGGEPVGRGDGGHGGVDGGEQLGRTEGVLFAEPVRGGDLDGGRCPPG